MEYSKRLLLFCVVIFGCFASNICSPAIENEWRCWKQNYGKTYTSELEEFNHWNIWLNNYKFVQQHNNRTDTGFTVDMNFMADQIHVRSPIKYNKENLNVATTKTGVDPPDSWDWRDQGAVGPVQNQDQIGDDLAIALAESVERYAFIKNGKLTGLSDSEVYDCCANSSSAYRLGGGFKCIHDIGGLCTEDSYPKSAGQCRNGSCLAVIQINGGVMVPKGDEKALKAAVYKPPVMVLNDASYPSFQLYRSGVYTASSCSRTQLNHALQVVGYGFNADKSFWICKNSWGRSWGNQGYINIARNHGNMCGIATQASYPV